MGSCLSSPDTPEPNYKGKGKELSSHEMTPPPKNNEKIIGPRQHSVESVISIAPEPSSSPAHDVLAHYRIDQLEAIKATGHFAALNPIDLTGPDDDDNGRDGNGNDKADIESMIEIQDVDEDGNVVPARRGSAADTVGDSVKSGLPIAGGAPDLQQPLEAKVLLLGAGESGKSTILKQMRIIHNKHFTDDEKVMYKAVILRNIVDSIQAFLKHMRRMGLEPHTPLGEIKQSQADERPEAIAGYFADPADIEDFGVAHTPPESPRSRSGSIASEGFYEAAAKYGRAGNGVMDVPGEAGLFDVLEVDPVKEHIPGWKEDKIADEKRRIVNGISKVPLPQYAHEEEKKGKSFFSSNPKPSRQAGRPPPVSENGSSSSISRFGAFGKSPTTSIHIEGRPRRRTLRDSLDSADSDDEMCSRRQGPPRQYVEALDAVRTYKLYDGQAIGTWFGEIVEEFWKDGVVPEVMAHSSDFYMMDNAPYFFMNARRICQQMYIPTIEDILKCRLQTRGVAMFDFQTKSLNVRLVDVGGQRTERRRWISVFEGLKCVIFLISLADYDMDLAECPGKLRMEESLELWHGIVTSRWFQNVSFVNLYNKMDIFAEKVKRVPLEKFFPEYRGGPNVENAVKYIVWRYMWVNENTGITVYNHICTATDTDRVKVMMAAVTDNILDIALKECGLL